MSTSCAIFCQTTSAETESKHHIMIQDTSKIINSVCFVDGGTGTSRKQNIERMSNTHAFGGWTGYLSEPSFVLGPAVTIYNEASEGREAAALMKTLNRLATLTGCANEMSDSDCTHWQV